MRSKPYRDPNQYRQMETLVSRYGRRDRRSTYISKLIRSSYNYTKYVHRLYSSDNNGGTVDGGLRQPLGFEQVGNVAYMPILIFDMTEIPQATASSARTEPAAWRLTQNVTSGVVGFQVLNGLDNSGATPAAGFVEQVNMGSTAGVGSTSGTRRALMEYVNIRFRIRGPIQRATRVVVQLVQPYAWFLGCPQEFQLTSGAITNENYQEWINMAARNTASPIQSIPSTIKRPWRVLRAKTYEIQPTSTTESDANGHDVVQKWFWRCNRVVQYDYQGYINTDNPNATDLNIGDATTPEACTRNYTALGKRVFLVVSAYSPNSDAAFNPLIHPSFEWYFEKKLSSLTGQITY